MNKMDYGFWTVIGTAACSLPLLLLLLRLKIRWTPYCKDLTLLTGKTVLITGATSGIGHEVALECGRRGAELVIGYRSKDKLSTLLADLCGQGVDLSKVTSHYLDLAEPSSVLSFVADVSKSISKLDVLVNNAAYQGPKCLNSRGSDVTMTTNFLSHYFLTRLLVENADMNTRYLRIINVTSGSYSTSTLNFEDMGMNTRPYEIYKSYGECKLALLLFSLSLPRKMTTVVCKDLQDIPCIAVHPGAVNTGIMSHWPGISGKLLRMLSALCFRSVSQGAASVVYAIVTDRAREFSGQLLTDCAIRKVNHPNMNDEDIEKLWQYADQQYKAVLNDTSITSFDNNDVSEYLIKENA